MQCFMIEERRPCARCRNRRTVRFGATSFCFNCRAHRDAWTDEGYPFTDTELARLHVYRAAVRAGFYTDRLAR